jgi:RimJ/RimL family protein N-acetyltransferase
MTKIPLTRRPAPVEIAAAIRRQMRRAAPPSGRLADLADAAAFHRLIADPAVSAPIYTLPKPATLAAARDFIAAHIDERRRGEGLLTLDFDGDASVAGYKDIRVWPEWSAAEVGGAVRPDRQGQGAGAAGAAAVFEWLFSTIGVDLICETAALDNLRTHKLLDHLGFRRLGEIDSELATGGVRRSLYWEMTRAEWEERRRR